MNPGPPLVSIIMPACQAAGHIAAALDSALAQTYPRLEIIVVDDGSTDATPAILQSYARAHGIQVITQSNAGQSAALNRGLTAARGDYVKFFDADDLLAPRTVEIQVHALSTQPAGRLAYGEWARFRRDPAEAVFTPHPGWAEGEPLNWLTTTWADGEPMYQCALWLIPRGLLDKVGGWDERLSLINDFEFFTRLVLASTGIVHTPGARLYYRSGLAHSLSRQTSRRALESAVLSARLAGEHLRRVEDSPQTRRLAANMLQNLLYSYYPSEPALMAALQDDIRRLGGATLRPSGGRCFRIILRLFGWRCALRLRRRR